MENKTYIPALKYNWLTKIYNPLVAFTMPETKFKKALINQANIKPNSVVLDFGVGTATLSILLKKEYSQVKLEGVDVDNKILEIAKQKIKEQDVDVELTQYDGIKLPYPDNYFDRVVTSLVFHHLDREQKENSLKEIYRVLKPNGELHIADWGLSNNVMMRLLFYLVQFLDGFKTTTDNVKGLLPAYIKIGGFKNVEALKSFNTIFGTLWLYKGIKLIH
ncbi:MAG: class I SAM-dependent methyltransferase [Bacteroidia bacterium]|jgi:ubiquinone/menaquinone biosynthesis C-methylase UbiE|nr:class I SAM-dependent methyltransferase [Bacteroidia bacterium]